MKAFVGGGVGGGDSVVGSGIIGDGCCGLRSCDD